MSPMPHAAGRKAAAVGSLVAGAVIAAVSPTPHAHAADRGSAEGLDLTRIQPVDLRVSPHVENLTGEVTHGLGSLMR